MPEYYGKYGGRVIRKFKADKVYIAGAILKASDVEAWPQANCRALAKAGSIEWFGPDDARGSAVSAPSKKAAKVAGSKSTRTAAKGKGTRNK